MSIVINYTLNTDTLEELLLKKITIKIMAFKFQLGVWYGSKA